MCGSSVYSQPTELSTVEQVHDSKLITEHYAIIIIIVCVCVCICQESRVVDVLSESDYHRSVIGYFCHDMKKFWSRGRRDLCLFLHSSFSVSCR